MRFRIVYNAPWMRTGWAMVFWPWMWVGLDREHFSDRHFRHELEHCYQVQRQGRLWFLVSYSLLWLRHGAFWGGYRNHPYEVEAKAREKDPLTEQERRWRDQGIIEL